MRARERKMSSWNKYVGALFDTRLYTEYRALSDLPYVQPEVAKNWLFWTWAFFWAIYGILFTLGVGRKDALLTPNISGVGAVLACLAATGLIALKQWRYYYGGPGPKDGIFVQRLRQGSPTEALLDSALSAAGGVLLGMAVIPTWERVPAVVEG